MNIGISTVIHIHCSDTFTCTHIVLGTQVTCNKNILIKSSGQHINKKVKLPIKIVIYMYMYMVTDGIMILQNCLISTYNCM